MYAAARRGSPEADPPPHVWMLMSMLCEGHEVRIRFPPPSTPLPPYGLSVGAILLPFLLAFPVMPAIIIARFMHFDVMLHFCFLPSLRRGRLASSALVRCAGLYNLPPGCPFMRLRTGFLYFSRETTCRSGGFTRGRGYERG